VIIRMQLVDHQHITAPHQITRNRRTARIAGDFSAFGERRILG
jgi:hypothetical protein